MEWIFDGIGTAVFTAIIGLVVGGVSGYRIGITKNIKLNQKNSGQSGCNIQIGEVNNGSK